MQAITVISDDRERVVLWIEAHRDEADPALQMLLFNLGLQLLIAGSQYRTDARASSVDKVHDHHPVVFGID